MSRMMDEPKRVLVAGGAGFVGSAIVRRLAAAGHAVFVADSLIFGQIANVPGQLSNVEFAKHDFVDRGQTQELFDSFGPTHVISCVGDTFVTSAYDDPHRFVDNNVVANLNIIAASQASDCKRLVYLSSTEIYGDRTEGALTEDAPFDPLNTYAVTKLAADRIAYTFALEHGARLFIARIFNAYGPRETHAYIIPEIIEQLATSDVVTLGNVEARRDFTFVDDTARGVCMLLDCDAPNGSAFNIGSSVEVKIKDVAMQIANIMGKPHAKIVIDPARFRRRDIDSFRADFAKLHKATGWSPSTSLELGLRKTVEWFVDNGGEWPWANAAKDERRYAGHDKPEYYNSDIEAESLGV